MSSIFLSHSSRDNEIAQEIGAWLAARGHRSVFLDFDPANGIPAGRNWEKELYQRVRTCRAMITLCSEHWMASRWCFMELTHARALGKQIFPLRVDDSRLDGLISESQIVDLRGDRAEALSRLWNGLLAAGIDPADAFDWDGSRPAYPGLLAFQEEDAAIFFGRDAEIGEGLDLLNKCHRLGDPRLVLVLGASGSGKSSLVRAGMLPRLRRDVGRWLVLDPFRPREDPAGELAAVLSRAAGGSGANRDAESWRRLLTTITSAVDSRAPAQETGDGAEIDAFLEALAAAEARLPAPVRQSVTQSLRTLRASAIRARAGAHSGPRDSDQHESGTEGALDIAITELRHRFRDSETEVVLTIDQFEELLGHRPDHPCSRFLDLLGSTLRRRGPLIVLATMRSDFLGNFQQAPALSGVRYESLSLGPMSPDDIAEVIERPAQLEGIELGPGLVAALLEDAREQDALPLLSFTLRELATRYGHDGRIDLDEYRSSLGGMQTAVAKSAEELIAREHLGPQQMDDLRRAFLRMVRITDEGAYARRTAQWSELPSGIHGLLETLVTARLLVSRDEGRGKVVEVAHEALFKSWTRLVEWLKDSTAALRLREEIGNAAQHWHEAGRPAEDLWRGGRLVRARELRDRGDIPLDPIERSFVEASVAAADAALRVEQARRRRRMLGLTAVAVGGTVLSILAGLSALSAKRAQAQADVAARAAEERARESSISAARARAAQNFAEHQRVLTRIQASPPDSFSARALAALAPKYLEQSKRHLEEATKLQLNLAQWKREHGTTPVAAEAALSLELVKARNNGSSLLLHYGTRAAPRLMLVDGGNAPDHSQSLKPRLLALRQQRHPGGMLPIDLVVSSQTDIQHMGGLIRLVNELARAPAADRYARIGALWSNAFVPPSDAPLDELVKRQPKAGLILAAQRLGIPINRPFSKMVTLPEAGAARVHWDQELSITILGPSLEYLRVFARGWLRDWERRLDSRGTALANPTAWPSMEDKVGTDAESVLLNELTLETFADSSLELIPSPLEIARPDVRGGIERSYVNLGSIVLLVEFEGKRVLLPADSRADLLISALAQAGYTDEHGRVDLDAMALPHGGSKNNVSLEFFRLVKADHYVFHADGTFKNPALETLSMLFAARRQDRRPFTIYLTNAPEDYREDYQVKELCALLQQEKDAGTPFRILTPQKGQTSLTLHLLGALPELPSGVEWAGCTPSR